MKPARFLSLAAIGMAALLPGPLRAEDDVLPAEYQSLAGFEEAGEIMRYLYRWYLDHADIEEFMGDEEAVFYVLPVRPELDPGDKSLFAQLVIPAVGVDIHLKKTDYAIEELGIRVESDRFKIVSVEKLSDAFAMPPGAVRCTLPLPALLAYLFNTRAQADPPGPEMLERMERAAREQLKGNIKELPAGGEQDFFLAPISPVANEVWVFWEEAKLLLRWHSDINIADPAVWEHESLAVESYDIDEQTVLSFTQVPGSNAYMTRDQVGRILFNCIIYGKKLVVPWPEE